MNPTGEAALMLAVGLLPLIFAVWCWAGRSGAARWWVGSPMNERMIRVILPGWGLILTPAAANQLLFERTPYEPTADTVMVSLVVPGLALGVWGLCFLPIPRWWAPRWHQQLSDAERQPNLHEPLSALTVGVAHVPNVRSSEQAARVFAGSPRIGSWQGNYVYDPDSDEQAHSLAPKGAVAGRLTAHEAGLVFAASRFEDNARGRPTVLSIDAADITGVRVVPARAGADGVRRPGSLWYRSMFPRLVVDTSRGSYVFDFMRSGRVAEQIRPLTGRRR